MPRPGAREFALLLLLAFIWGSSFTLIKVVVPHLPPLSLTLWRVALATVALLAAAWWLGERLRFSATAWGWIVLAGLTGNILPFTLISWGEEHIDSGLAAILISMTPFMVLLLAHFLTGDERITPRRAVGMMLGLAGIMVLMGPNSLQALGEDMLRQLAIIAAAACYAVNTLMVRHLQLRHLHHGASSATASPDRNSNRMNYRTPGAPADDRGQAGGAHGSVRAGSGPVALAAAIMLASTIVLLPFVPWLEGVVIPAADVAAWAVLLGLLHTGVATLIMFAIVRRAGATFFATINFLIPVIGYLLGVLLLGESFSLRAVLALALILAGITAVSGVPLRRHDTPGNTVA